MLLTITTTHNPATDLGYLLYKHPERTQSFEMAYGQAHVFYPEVAENRCTVALLLDVDPVGLVRGKNADSFTLSQYVNDRPYVASSFLSVAIAQVFGTALSGRSKERPELAQTPIPLLAKIAVLPCRGGEELLHGLFEPLGYTLTAEQHPLDEAFPEWGKSRYYTVTLEQTIRLGDLLSHLYVLIPVLDDYKHYYVDHDEVEKLLRHGQGWLAEHPARDLITKRYLKYQHSLKREALSRLIEEEMSSLEIETQQPAEREQALEKPMRLHDQRLGTVISVLKSSGAERILDLGCGEGRLLQLLLKEKQFTEIVGMDVSYRTLEIAADRLRLDRMPEKKRERIQLIQGALTYRDERLVAYDAAAVVEVIEHLDPPRLAAFERVLFEFARPTTVVLTTPNVEYNVMWESLPTGKLRHRDHRFEWARAEFQHWAEVICGRFGYTVRFLPIGPEDTIVGSPSQMAVFDVEARSHD